MSGARNYKTTLQLPRTEFAMRGKMAQREPEMLAEWEASELPRRIEEASQGRPRFVLHDGPPYANGQIHYGHILNKVLKDIVVRYRTMAGFRSIYRPGWDCHGLPIELQVDRDLGKRKAEMSVGELRAAYRDYALRFIDTQREEFKRLGVGGRWDQPYRTLDKSYEATIVRELAGFAERGYLYRGKKPVHWCASCGTALAEAEVEYRDHTSPSIYVAFDYKGDAAALSPALAGRDVAFVIWTTTPWTIPANLAIALNPRFTYVAIEHAATGKALVVARDRVAAVAEACGLDDPTVIGEIDVEAARGSACAHPFIDRDSVILFGDHVTLEAGTGCVHTAPGHGHDDYVLGINNGLEVLTPVDDRGCFDDQAPDYTGQHVFKANPLIVQRLADVGALINAVGAKVAHSYPHCWRCKNPVIFRATTQWFAKLDHKGLRSRALTAVDETAWIPPWGRDRIFGMIENRPDWCLSRQRLWGVPIPVFFCGGCHEPQARAELMRHVGDIFAEHGADEWFVRSAHELVPDGTTCSGCGASADDFEKGSDIVDVWFESGVSWAAVCEGDDDLWPIDLYLEGTDQHRGWFHSALLTSVAGRDAPPYKAVLTHGFIVNEKGQAYSKSLKNFVPPEKVIKARGAEIFRMWVASVDYRNDTPYSEGLLTQLADAYRKLRNTTRFLLGNLAGLPVDYAPRDDELTLLDRWALARLDAVIATCRRAYDNYEFHQVFRTLVEFCTTDLSAFYLDVAKDRLYCDNADDRRGTQAVLYRIARALAALMAPVLCFTAEDVWRHLPQRDDDPDSVHLVAIPDPSGDRDDAQLLDDVARLRAVRDVVLKQLEPFRAEKHHSLDAHVTLHLDDATRALVERYPEALADLFIVSEATVQSGNGDARAEVQAGDGVKCPRCWKRTPGQAHADDPALCTRCAHVVGDTLPEATAS